jgi:hypothetical protein
MARPVVLLGLPLLALLLAAADAPPPAAIQKAFGNTIVSTYPDGRQAELWLEPSGSYTALGRRHDPSSGHWNVSGGKLCLKQAHPFAPPFFRYCTPIPTSEEWTARAVTGETIRVRLEPGRPTSSS